MQALLISHSSGDQLPMLVDDAGLPIAMASEYLLARRGLASSTLMRNARELAIIHQWVEEQNVDLESLFSAATRLKKPMFDTSLPDGLRKKVVEQTKGNVIDIRGHRDHLIVVGDITFMQRLSTAIDYFTFWFEEFAERYTDDEVRYAKIQSHKSKIIGWLKKRSIRPRSNRRGDKALSKESASNLLRNLKRALSMPLMTDISEIHVVSKSAYVSARNYVLTALMLFFGMRPGEILTLRVSDIILSQLSQVNVTRRRPDVNDKRKPRPAIKANGRPLPFQSREFAREMGGYIFMLDAHMNECRKNHDYLIVSDEGDPLSYASVNALFQRLRRELGSEFHGHLNAKSLRHTYSTNLENELRDLGVTEERRRRHLAFARGDSSLSSQDTYLDGAFMNEFNEANRKIQGELYGF